MIAPLFEFDENEKNQKAGLLGINLESFDYIQGCDEAGRGPAAGGVWAACVSFFEGVDISLFEKLNDSKKLSPKTREFLFNLIKENSYFSIKEIDVEKIEEINILNASLLAMKCAAHDVINQIQNKKGNAKIITLVDGNKLIKDFKNEQKYIIKGDSKSASIAAASILAKVSRDLYMDKISKEYPMYDWQNNKGYLTKKHIEAIKKYGISKYHRKSFLKNIIKGPQISLKAK